MTNIDCFLAINIKLWNSRFFTFLIHFDRSELSFLLAMIFQCFQTVCILYFIINSQLFTFLIHFLLLLFFKNFIIANTSYIILLYSVVNYSMSISFDKEIRLFYLFLHFNYLIGIPLYFIDMGWIYSYYNLFIMIHDLCRY